MKSAIAIATCTAALMGCATHADVVRSGVRIPYKSDLSPSNLARCMVREHDGSFMGSVRLSIVDPTATPIEVTISQSSIDAVVHISAKGAGSYALFHVATTTPEGTARMFIKGCQAERMTEEI